MSVLPKEEFLFQNHFSLDGKRSLTLMWIICSAWAIMFFPEQTVSTFNTYSPALLVFQQIIEPLMCEISDRFKVRTLKTLMQIFWSIHKQLILYSLMLCSVRSRSSETELKELNRSSTAYFKCQLLFRLPLMEINCRFWWAVDFLVR